VAVPPRLSLVTLGARDVPALRRFYESLWGPSPSPPGDEFARFELGGAVLAVFSLPALAEEVGLPAPSGEESFAGFTCAINVEEEAMVDEAMEAVRGAGGRVLAQPTTREWGGRSGYFTDPEANVWEIAWVPGASFDARGALVWPG
jgi:uncharacterized protein